MQSTSSNRGFRRVAANVLAGLSFALFALAVISLHQERSIPFVIEEAGQFPTVLSYYLFGAKDELVDAGLTRFFREQVRALPAEDGLASALKADIKPTHDLAPMDDGNGIGMIMVLHAAFAMFGLHAYAMSLFFLVVLGISTAAFMLRFQDRRIFSVPVLFTTYTALILSPLTLPAVAVSAPFGGIRSYALVGILAAVHWCFDVSEGVYSRPNGVVRWFSLAVQVAVLGVAILVRGSPAYLLGPVSAVGLYQLYRNWGWSSLRTMVLRAAAPILALTIVLFSIAPIAYPEYARAGRAFTAVWHRVFISFGAHPAWPFPGLREKYPCPDIPEGLTPVGSDRSGHCIWWTYVREHHVPVEKAQHETYNEEYDRVLRSAVWYVARTYPKETLETFFYVKPKLIVKNILFMLKLHAPAGRQLPVIVFVLQCALVIAFMIAWPSDTALADIASGVHLVSLFLLFGLVPQIIAWASPPDAIDYNVYVMCAIILAFWGNLTVGRMTIVRFIVPRMGLSWSSDVRHAPFEIGGPLR